MAVSFPRLPRWLCGGGGGGGNTKKESKGSPSSSSSLKKSKSGPSSLKKIKRGWTGRGGGGGEEGKMGNVMFPEPDDPEWSTGWVEPHGPGFKSEDDTTGGFVVLVPCYKKVIDSSGNQIPNAFLSPATDKKNMEQWLSSMGKL